MSESDDNWLRIDEQTDVIVSLAGCLHCIGKVQEEPAFWKHVIVDLHNAVQGAMVCHLSGTAQVGALSEKSVRKVLEWHENDRNGKIDRKLVGEDEWGPIYQPRTRKDAYPATRLADAAVLFERLHSEESRTEGGVGAILDLSESQRSSFGRLHGLRNSFSHFTPMGWSIELSGLPRICLDVLGVLEMIADDVWPFRHLGAVKRRQIRDLLSCLREKLQIDAAKRY